MNNHIRPEPEKGQDIDIRTPDPSCRRCGFPSPMTIDIVTRADEARLTMSSCPRCEHRQWTDDGEVLAGPDILRLLSGDRDFSLALSARGARRRARAAVSGERSRLP